MAEARHRVDVQSPKVAVVGRPNLLPKQITYIIPVTNQKENSMWMKNFFPVAALTLLVACGGGSEDQPARVQTELEINAGITSTCTTVQFVNQPAAGFTIPRTQITLRVTNTCNTAIMAWACLGNSAPKPSGVPISVYGPMCGDVFFPGNSFRIPPSSFRDFNLATFQTNLATASQSDSYLADSLGIRAAHLDTYDCIAEYQNTQMQVVLTSCFKK